MLATEEPTPPAPARPPAPGLLEIHAQNERMRHIPPLAWIVQKLDHDLRRRIEKLWLPYADLAASDPRAPRAGGRVPRALPLHRPRRPTSPAATAATRIRPTTSAAASAGPSTRPSPNLNAADADTFGKRLPFQTLERSNNEPLWAAMLVGDPARAEARAAGPRDRARHRRAAVRGAGAADRADAARADGVGQVLARVPLTRPLATLSPCDKAAVGRGATKFGSREIDIMLPFSPLQPHRSGATKLGSRENKPMCPSPPPRLHRGGERVVEGRVRGCSRPTNFASLRLRQRLEPAPRIATVRNASNGPTGIRAIRCEPSS